MAAEGIFEWGEGGKRICEGPWIGGAPIFMTCPAPLDEKELPKGSPDSTAGTHLE